MKKLFFVCLFAIMAGHVTAATRNAFSPAYIDVNNAVNGVGTPNGGTVWNTPASNGDIVTVPAGSATWSSALDLGTKAIQLRASGGITLNDNNKGSDATTIITNGLGGNLILSRNTGGNLVRISGFKFISVDNTDGVISFAGPATKVRADHCYFEKGDHAIHSNYRSGEHGNGPVWGVQDHNTYHNMKRPIYVWDVRNGDVVEGDASWAEGIHPGTEQMMYVEDNLFILDGTVPGVQFPIYGGGGGGQLCFRYNTTQGYSQQVDAHSNVPYYEIYNNTFNIGGPFAPGYLANMGQRGGQWIVHDNTFSGGTAVPATPHGMTVYYTTDPVPKRVKNTFLWGNIINGTVSNNVSFVYDGDGGTCTAACGTGGAIPGQCPTNGSGVSCGGYSATQIVLNAQYFNRAPNGSDPAPYTSYSALVHPHPLVQVASPAPAITISPMELNFGEVEVNSAPGDLTVTIKNEGNAVGSGTVTVPSPFSIVSGGTYTNLTPGSSQTVTVRYRPTVQAYSDLVLTVSGTGGTTSKVKGVAYSILTSPFDADDGVIILPFVATAGVVSQPIDTDDPNDGGHAIYGFNIVTAGDYLVGLETDTPTTANNSFFDSVDTPPVDPTDINDIIPVTSGFEYRDVNGRGTGTSEPQFQPRTFTLSVGHHRLYHYGRELDGKIKTIRITPVTGPTPTPTPTPIPPSIVTHPSNQTVAVGQTATFSVSASGASPLTYQWQKNGTNISGAIGTVYVTPATVAGDSGATFRAVVTNVSGNVISNNATLTVNSPPVVVTNAATNVTSSGATLNGTFNPKGQNTTFYFEYGLTSIYGNITSSSINTSGVSVPVSATANLSGLSQSTLYHYRLHATNAGGTGNGSDVTFTTSAVVTPTPTPTPTPAPSPPAIVTQPSNQSVLVGRNAVFNVTASGAAPLSYQWTKDNVNIFGATGTGYVTPTTVIEDDQAKFSVSVTNSFGTTTSNNAILTVTAEPTPTPPPPPPNFRISGGEFTHPRNGFLKLSYFKPFWLTFQKIVSSPPSTGAAETANFIYHDRIYNVSRIPTLKDFTWAYTSEADRPETSTIIRTSSDPDIVSPSEDSLFKWNSHSVGTATLTVSTLHQTETALVTTGDTSVVRNFAKFAFGSAAAQITATIDTAIAGKQPGDTTQKLFTTYIPPSPGSPSTPGTFARNPNVWAPWDFTCFSTWNSFGIGGSGGPQRAGTLISPRHIMLANHFWIPNGTVMQFTKANNTTIARTIVNGSYVSGSGDMYIALLDSDVPAGINFTKVMPETWFDQLVTPDVTFSPVTGAFTYESDTYPYPMPVIRMDQARKVWVQDLRYMSKKQSNNPNPGAGVECKQPTDPQRLMFYQGLINFDSGSPIFTIVNGQTVMLACLVFNGGDNYAAFIKEINQTMDALGGGYHLTAVDLSAFPPF